MFKKKVLRKNVLIFTNFLTFSYASLRRDPGNLKFKTDKWYNDVVRVCASSFIRVRNAEPYLIQNSFYIVFLSKTLYTDIASVYQ